MGKPGWLQFVMALAIAGIGFYHALTVKPGSREPKSARYILKNYAFTAGWIAAIGGSILALRILLLILKKG